ncbi:MAG: hypothetical protein ACE5G9_11635, partial [Nitrospinales bacterium]
MSFRERQSIEHRIDALLQKAKVIEDDELKAEIAKYLCILSSGFLEIACRDIIQRYVRSRTSPEVRRFVNG